MSKITITKEVKRGDTDYDIQFNITEQGCTVCRISPTQGLETFIQWKEMDDLEELSEIFAEVPVGVFRVIVQTLGQVYNSKDSYMEQLQ